MALKNFNAIGFRKHLITQRDRTIREAERLHKGDTMRDSIEYMYFVGKENALSDLLDDMELFAEFE